MPIDYPYEFDKISLSSNLKKVLGTDNRDWIVWWYCGIKKNIRSNCQPHVFVAFRELVDGKVGYASVLLPVLLTSLGSLRIGSVWKNGRCNRIAHFEERSFSVNLENNHWHTSFKKAREEWWELPFNQRQYPLKSPHDTSMLLQFKADTGEIVSIPSLEFFSRMYGASEKIKRVVATYDRENCKKRFFRAFNQPEEDEVWKFVRQTNLKKDDNVFLAHFLTQLKE